MVAECLILGSYAKAIKDVARVEFLKSQHLELSNEEKQEFLEDKDRRFIHFTSKKAAEDILKSGFFIPAKSIINNHFTKEIDNNGNKKNANLVYMFDSKKISVDDYIRNLPKKSSPYNGNYEYYAVSMSPDEYEINNFKRRAQDGAITYNGRLDLDGTDTKIVKYILGLDENNEYTLNQVPLDFEYTPDDNLMSKLNKEKMSFLKFTLAQSISEFKKAKVSAKQYRADKEKYKEQIRNKIDFAKANKQFQEEEKEKNYIFEQDGKQIVVKNLEYEMVGGKKLQKISILGNGFENENQSLEQVVKTCYMDELDIENIENEVATKYFFQNYNDMLKNEMEETKYIGLPLINLETGEVLNDYDDKFKKYYDRKIEAKQYADEKYNKYKESKKITTKIKSFFNKIFRRNDVKLLSESVNQKYVDKEKLARLGDSSIQAINSDNPNITILDEQLSNLVNTPEKILDSQQQREMIEEMKNKEQEISDMYIE